MIYGRFLLICDRFIASRHGVIRCFLGTRTRKVTVGVYWCSELGGDVGDERAGVDEGVKVKVKGCCCCSELGGDLGDERAGVVLGVKGKVKLMLVVGG